jgi:hypothetical protein
MNNATYILALAMAIGSATAVFAEPIVVSGVGQLRGRETVHEGFGLLRIRGTGLFLDPLFFAFNENMPCDSDGPSRCALAIG